ncbi:MAG: hypoxanthine phosphoribosyltransferase [Myxococcales bacterium]|nr:hypoxanthine phosphoribosyltransferase [Myxococcales bacterium]MCB9520091.1 hypoxanthine phosphoribosyltransferase [Myxococcales bacterium]MCB9531817.1 hypoxanthine phosphoribosyltransferase [Myxococcales bacterium]
MSTIESPRVSVLLSADAIAARVAALGAQLSEDYRGRDVVLVCILKGSLVFFADLLRAVTIPTRCDYLAVESYEGTSSSGEVRFTADLRGAIEGRDVLLVEDIVDTGLTMAYLLEALSARKPSSIEVVTLLDKPSRRRTPVSLRYVGFEIPDAFVVGYGLDYEQYFRNLPFVGVLEEVPSLG